MSSEGPETGNGTLAKVSKAIEDDRSYLKPHVHPNPIHVPSSTLGVESLAPTKLKWNTDSLGLRLSSDAASALTSAALICPLITILDKSIIEKAAKGVSIQKSVASSLKNLVLRPHKFLISTPFLLIYSLYSCTYLTANVIDTVVSTLDNDPFNSVSAGPAKFASTAIVNMSICVYKDTRFAKMFGAQGTSTTTTTSTPSPSKTTSHPAQTVTSTESLKIPKKSLGLFCIRDSMTIFASFNLPPLVSPYIPDMLASTPSSKYFLAQFTIPAAVQIFSTPVHLLGLDLYNRQPAGGLPPAERWARVKRDWAPGCAARMGRVLPAYGVGGVVNTKLRARFMHSLQG